jgi:hypothetical protein
MVTVNADPNDREVASWSPFEVGRNPDIYDADGGKLLKAGSRVVINSAHLHANGTATRAHLEYAYWFHPKGYKPKWKTTGVGSAGSGIIDLKGMQANQKLEGFTTLQNNTKLTAFEPHLHAAGVRMCLDAFYGLWWSETLTCAGYNHSWVRIYNYSDDAAPLLPKGTILRVTAYFDTTPANKNVADPRNWSGMGNRSIDNMFYNLSQGIELTDQEFKEEMEARRKKLNLQDGEVVPGCPLCSSIPSNSTIEGSNAR